MKQERSKSEGHRKRLRDKFLRVGIEALHLQTAMDELNNLVAMLESKNEKKRK